MPAKKRTAKKSRKKFDRAKVEKAVRLLLEGIGEDPGRDGLVETPRRVAGFYEEILAGMGIDPAKYLVPLTTDYEQDIVIVKDIGFVSVCEHHMLPFIGKVHVGYVPDDGKLVGVSKILRAVDAVAGRLQIQERMTAELADAIDSKLGPAGVLVLIEAEHLCMTIRGVKKPGALMVTSEARGVLREPDRQALVLSSFQR
ncbi:MAG: GTP cyclohydrolase I FolE [bacterium]